MSNREKVILSLLIIIVAAGIYFGKFFGGFVAGGASILLFVSIVGNRLAKKAIERIDKQIKDIIVENEG